MPSGEALQVPLERPSGRAPFKLVLPWELAGDQPRAVASLLEGLAKGEGKAVVDAFVARDALQCGFCTPGMVTSCAAAVATHGVGLTIEQARAATAGNLCRCGTYPHVLQAALDAAKLAARKG